jgi:hypothetical protein
VAVGTQRQVARYRGEDCSGAFTCTLVAVRREAGWAIVNVQLSQVPARKSSTWVMFRAGSGAKLGADALPDGRLYTTQQTYKGDTAMTMNEAQQTQQTQQTQQAEQAGQTEQAAAVQLPQPDPALRRLDRFVGTWNMKGRTLGSDVDNVEGQTSFEWLPGGYFLQQRVRLNFAGFQVEGLEVIGYDAATGTYPSTVYPSMAGMPLPYRWEIEGDELTITTDLLGAVFHGRWDGTSFSGGWRPMPGREGPGNVAYDVSGGRADG